MLRELKASARRCSERCAQPMVSDRLGTTRLWFAQGEACLTALCEGQGSLRGVGEGEEARVQRIRAPRALRQAELALRATTQMGVEAVRGRLP